MNISALAIRNPVFTWMLMFGLLLFGALAYRSLGISLDPDVDAPVVNVGLRYAGAAPEVMEKDVVDPIESVVVAIEGIKSIFSSASQGRANISLEFELSKDIDVAVQEVQTAIARAIRTLPNDMDPPIVTKSNPEDRPIVWLAIRSNELSQMELMRFVRNRIRDQFTTISGVSEVILGGYVEPALNVELSVDRLRQYQLTVDDILSTIQREHVELPAGRIENSELEKTLRVMGEAMTLEEFRQLQIQRRGGAPNFVPLSLGQVADVQEGLDEIRRISRVMGESSVGLGIRKQRGANTVEVATLVKERAEQVRGQLPEGVFLSINFDSSPFIEGSVQELIRTLIFAALLTAFVCWLFLGTLSATSNIFFAIPTSVIGTFIIVYALGFTLNSFTLLALTLAIGIVVDDAIIVLENIMRHRDMGKNKIEAALAGSREILFAVIATTAALVAMFVPVAFMSGVVGQYFYQFAMTISVAVILSSVEALTLTPMRCSLFLQQKQRVSLLGRSLDLLMDKLRSAYSKSLPFVLNYRWSTLTLAFSIFAGSLYFFTQLPREFSPEVDEGRLFLQMETPIGSSLEYTDQRMREVEALIMNQDFVERYFIAVGGMGAGGQANVANMFVTLKDRSQRALSQREIASQLRQRLSSVEGVRLFVRGGMRSLPGGGRGFAVEFSLRGGDWDELVHQFDRVSGAMEESGLFTDINRGSLRGAPEVWVIPDRIKTQARGVDVAELSQAIRVMFGGVVAGQYTRDGQRYDVRVQLKAQERENLESLKRILVRNNRGELIPMGDLVNMEERLSPPSITREERVRSVTLRANLADGVSQGEGIEQALSLAQGLLPEGYYVALSGASASLSESFQSLGWVMLLGVLVAYMVLASQFNSFIDPLVVLAALPFALSGAFLALYSTGQSLNIYSLIGLILLMGIVKKNSILLVEFTNQARRRGLGVKAALIEACPLRLRPILMTSLATVAAAIPAALNTGPGAETRWPMAFVIIGGMLVSTLFTLFVVPCLYSLMARPRPSDRSSAVSLDLGSKASAQSVLGDGSRVHVVQKVVRSTGLTP